VSLRFIISLVLTLSSFALTVQEYITNIQHYNLEKGLETRNIQLAYKDSQGFMWFSTNIGAYRFDGYKFKIFHQNQTTDAPFYTTNTNNF